MSASVSGRLASAAQAHLGVDGLQHGLVLGAERPREESARDELLSHDRLEAVAHLQPNQRAEGGRGECLLRGFPAWSSCWWPARSSAVRIGSSWSRSVRWSTEGVVAFEKGVFASGTCLVSCFEEGVFAFRYGRVFWCRLV